MYTLLIKLYYASGIAEALLLDTLSHHVVLNPIYISRRGRDDSPDAKQKKKTHAHPHVYALLLRVNCRFVRSRSRWERFLEARRMRRRRHANRGNRRERNRARGTHLYISIFNSLVSRERQHPPVRREKTESKIHENLIGINRGSPLARRRAETRPIRQFNANWPRLMPYHAILHSIPPPFLSVLFHEWYLSLSLF